MPSLDQSRRTLGWTLQQKRTDDKQLGLKVEDKRALVRTVALLLDLQRDGLPGLLQQTDGFTQRLPLQAAAVDGQDAIAHVDRPGPARQEKQTSHHVKKIQSEGKKLRNRNTSQMRSPGPDVRSWSEERHQITTF